MTVATPVTASPEVRKIVCGRCYAVLDAGDNFCRSCGAKVGEGSGAAAPVEQPLPPPTVVYQEAMPQLPPGQYSPVPMAVQPTPMVVQPAAAAFQPATDLLNRRRRWSDSRVLVLIMLFVVLGPFALPMLWRSRGFSIFWKLVLTIVVLGVCVWGVCQVWHSVETMVQALNDPQGTGGMESMIEMLDKGPAEAPPIHGTGLGI